MKVEETKLAGVFLITPQVYGDERGYFKEVFKCSSYSSQGLPEAFVQENHSRSAKNVLRGLHYQYPQWQGKLVRVINGEIYDVAVDIRKDSPTYGQWVGVTINAENHQQIYIPPGYAHGFCVTSEFADVVYACTTEYQASDDASIRWDDPDIAVAWPIDSPVLSEKDKQAKYLSEIHTSDSI